VTNYVFRQPSELNRTVVDANGFMMMAPGTTTNHHNLTNRLLPASYLKSPNAELYMKKLVRNLASELTN